MSILTSRACTGLEHEERKIQVRSASETAQIDWGHGCTHEHRVSRVYCDTKVLEIDEEPRQIAHRLGC